MHIFQFSRPRNSKPFSPIARLVSRGSWPFLLGSALMVLAVPVMAQPPLEPNGSLKQDFEQDLTPWTVLGQGAKVTLTHEADNVKAGTAALRYDYTIKTGQYGFLLAPVPVGVLTGFKAINFWARTKEVTPMILLLQEADGGRYVTTFTLPADSWQQVEVSPSDFILSEDKDDPKDPNNKLDMDKVNAVALLDLGEFLIQSPQIAKLLNLKEGEHTLYLDEMSISQQAPTAAPVDKENVTIDAFTHPQISWVGNNGMALKRTTDVGVDGPALQADYQQSATQLSLLLKMLGRGALTGTQTLSFQASSIKTATLAVQVEEYSGGKYNTLIEVPGGAQPKDFNLAWADFKPADDSKDDNGELNLDKVKELLVLDATGLAGQGEGKTRSGIGTMKAKK